MKMTFLISVMRNIKWNIKCVIEKSYECLSHGFSLRTVLTCDLYYENIPKSTEFPHPIGICIGPRVTLGENCRIQQNVTIGTRWKFDGAEVQPRIGNNVFIGAGATVLGPITIGDNVVIGANTVVLTDVPDNCVVYNNMNVGVIHEKS